MRHRALCRSALFLALSLLAPTAGLRAQAPEMQFSRSALVQRLLPTVVNITAIVPLPPGTAKQPAPEGAGRQKRQLGSGFVIDPAGVIVTNYHVVDGAEEVVATFWDGAQLAAKVTAADRLSDIALLKVDPPAPLAAVSWGDSDLVRIGDGVLAIGNPLGVGLSVTGGIVSALNRDIMSSPYDDYIQTDAPINHGNSGGPLFSMKGEVVGINTAIISPTTGSAGLGFAIPSKDARFVIGQLQEYGWIRPGWLGVKVQRVTPEIALALRMSPPRGSIVADVMAGSPAAGAGIRIGDVIVSFAGLRPPDDRSLLRDIAATAPGQQASIGLLRRGQAETVTATIEEWPRQRWEQLSAPITPRKARQEVAPDLGVTVGPLSSTARAEMGILPDAAGVLVTKVAADSEAAQRGLAPGDAILRIDDTPLRSAEDYRAALDAARREGRDAALLLVLPKQTVSPGPEWRALTLR